MSGPNFINVSNKVVADYSRQCVQPESMYTFPGILNCVIDQHK
jgi:hypothetical protein